MSTNLQFGRDVQGLNAYAPQFSTDMYKATLATGVADDITVPSNFPNWIMYAKCQPDGWAWCSRNDTAAVPSGGTFEASESDLVTGTIEFKMTVTAGDIISFITSNTTCDILVKFYPTTA